MRTSKTRLPGTETPVYMVEGFAPEKTDGGEFYFQSRALNGEFGTLAWVWLAGTLVPLLVEDHEADAPEAAQFRGQLFGVASAVSYAIGAILKRGRLARIHVEVHDGDERCTWERDYSGAPMDARRAILAAFEAGGDPRLAGLKVGWATRMVMIEADCGREGRVIASVRLDG